jgi:hypothetical protein
VEERAVNLIRQAVALGSTAIRTHVDIDPAIGLANLHGILIRVAVSLNADAPSATFLRLKGDLSPQLLQTGRVG